MPEKSHKPRWGLVLALGLFSIAFAVIIFVYAIAVVESGPFPAKSGGFLLPGFFFVGIGMGYLFLTPAISMLEKKIGKLEKELYEQKNSSTRLSYPKNNQYPLNPIKN